MKWCALLSLIAIAGSAGHAAAAEERNCPVRVAPLSDGELALARGDYAAALQAFNAMRQSAPDLSRNGSVRVLLQQDQLDQAKAIADSWLASEPASPAAMETMSEFLLRDGRIGESLQMALKASQADPCNARARLVLSSGSALSANFLTAVQLSRVAHAIDPKDLDIRRRWVGTLPRAQRMAEYLAMSTDPQTGRPEQRRHLAESLAASSSDARSSCRISSTLDHASIPLERIMNGPNHLEAMALGVQLNGKKRKLELDSGASGLLLTRGAAAALGLIRDVRTETGGIGDHGAVATSIAHIASVRIGNIEFTDCPVRILEGRTPLDVDGLVGADVFERYLVTIDYPGNTVQLAPLPRRPADAAGSAAHNPAEDDNAAPEPHNRYVAPEMKDWTHIYRRGHDLLLPVSIGESRPRLFIVDTGAASMLISPTAARAVTKVHGDPEMHIRGISGEVAKVYNTSNFVLRFAQLEQKVDNMTAIDTTPVSHDLGIEVAGFMGAPVLQLLAIHIDYRDNLIKFDYKTGYSGPPRMGR